MLTPSRQVSPNTIGSVKTPRIWFLKTPLLGLFLTLSFTTAFAGNIWDGGGGDNLWGTGANWDGDTSPVTGTTQDLYFAGTTRLTPQNNYNNWDDFRSIFFNSGAGAFTINGNPVDLWVASGSGKIQNNSSNTQTINFDSFSINDGNYEMNPVSGNLSVTSNNIFTNGRQIHVYGNQTLSFGASTVISQGGGLVILGGGTVIFQSAHTFTGQSYINSGTLRINPGGSANSSTLNLGDTSGSSNATLLLGGNNMSLSSAVNVRSGNTGSMTINASGSNLTLSGGITLNKNAAITAGAGNDLTISGAINTNSNTLDKLGAGNLTLTSTSNDANNRYYLGAGTLNVSAQTNLGNRATFDNKLYFDGGILNATASFTIQGNNGITFGNSGGRISVASGQTLTIQSYINDIDATNDFIKSGTGTLFLDKSDTNDFSHTTIRVYEGTLSTWNPGGLLSSTVQLGDTATSGTYQFTKTNGAVTADKTFSIAAGGGSINVTNDALSLGTGNLTGSGTFTKLGDGTLTVSGASNSHSGAVVVSAGSLALTSAISSSGFTLSGGNLSTSATNQLANTATLTVNTGTFTLGGADTVGAISGSGGTINLGANALTTDTASSSSYSGTITGTGGSLTKDGTGTLTLSGANTFSGGVTLNAGQLNINSATAIGNGTLAINGGTIDNTSAAAITLSNNNAQSWNGNFTFAGTRDLNMGTGTITLGANRTVTVASGNLTLGAATISGNYFITKDGNGTLDIGNVSRAWSPAGGFFINSGTLAMTAGNNLGTIPNANQLIFTGNSTLRLNANSTIAAGRGMAINSGVNASVDVSTAGNTFRLQNVISGSGSLTKIGSGNLTLEAANTYTGSTTISAGTLFAVDGSAIADTSAVSVSTGAMFTLNASETVGSIAGAGNITLGANTLTAGGDNSSTTFSGIASGAGGALTKSGTGTLTLSGDNTYSGATTVNAGTLSVSSVANGGSNSNIGASTAAAGNLVLGGGTLEYTGSTASTNRSFTLTAATTSAISVSNAATSLTISGAGAATTGALTKAGAGTLILSGANTYTGATTINAGTLQIGAGGTSGNLSASSAITNNANLAFNRTDTLTQGTDFASVISGTGNLIQAGTGNLILSGANTYSGTTTINAGTLTIGGSGTLGSANYTQTISNNGTFLFASSAAQILFGAITGTGNLTKTGAGAMTLNGTTANTYSGLTTITNGITYLGKTDGVNAISGNISLGDGSGGDMIYLLSGNQIADTSILTMTGTAANARGDFRLNGFSETIGGLSGDGLVQVDASTLVLNSTLTLNVASGLTLTSNATLRNTNSGTGPVLTLVKSGAGKQVLGNSANTYTGSTTINGGTLSVSTLANGGIQSNIGQSTNAATNLVLGGGTLEYTGSTISIDRNFTLSNGTTSAISVTNSANTLTITGAAAAGNGSLTKEGSGTLTLSGANAYTGATTINAGILQIGNAGTTGALSTSSAITNNAGLVFNRSNTVTQGTDFANNIGGSGTLTQNGSGTLALNTANSYTGATTINTGIIRASNATALGTTGVGTTVASGAVLELSGGISIGVEALSLAGTGISSGGALRNISDSNTYGGDIAIGSATRINSDSGTLTLSGGISGTHNLTIGGVGATTVSGAIATSTGTLTKDGAGTLTLSGANTYTGLTTISAGNITLSGGSALSNTGAVSLANVAGAILHVASSETIGSIQGGGTTGGTVSIASGQTLTVAETGSVTFSGTLSGTGTFEKSGAGTLTLTRNNTATFSGAVNISGGGIVLNSTSNQLGTGGITMADGTSIGVSGASGRTLSNNFTLTGNVTLGTTGTDGGLTLGASTRTLNLGSANRSITVANTANATTLNLAISGDSGIGLTKLGAGNLTLASATASTYTGATIVSAGTLFSDGSNRMSANSALVVESGATFGMNNNNTVASIAGAGNFQLGASTLTAGGDNTSTTVSGVISGATGSLTKTGSGTLTLNGTNTHGGTTTLSGGGLNLNSAAALGTSTLTISTAGVTIDNTSGGLVTLNNNAQNWNGNFTFTGTNNLDMGTGGVVIGANRTVTVSNNNLTIGGVISNSTANRGITKEGAGTLTLSGANTYSGATIVNAGTLVLNGSNTASAVTINSGGTLAGTGSGGAATVASGGRISPGGSSIGTLATSSLTLNGGGGYTFSIGNVSGTPGTEWDLINVGGGTGTVTINSSSGSPFTIYLNGNPTGWDNSGTYAWNIISSNNLSGFAADKFAVDLGGFTPVPTGSFYFTNSGSALVLNYAILGDAIWSGGTANWDTGFAPPVSTNANVFFTGAGGGTATNNIANATLNSLQSITFNSTAGAYTLAANSGSAGFDTASALTVTGPIVNNSTANQTVNLAMSFASTRVVDTASGNISIGGVISGAGGLSKNGTSTLTLTQSNTLTGAIQINEGTLATTGSGGFANTANITVASGATYNVGVSDQINTLTSPGSLVLSSGTLTISSSANSNISGAISGGGGLTKGGSGTITISNNNSGYSGETRLEGGVLEIGNNGALGTGSLAIRDTSTIRSTDATDRTIATNLGTFAGSSAVYTFGSVGTGNLTFSSTTGASIGTGARTFAINNANTTFAMGFSNSGSIDKTGTGTMILTGSSSYTGTTTISAGTLQIGAGGATGSIASPSIVNNSALVVDRTGTLTLSGNMSGSGTLTKNGSGTLVLSGSNSYNGATTLNLGTLTLQSSNALGTSTLTQSSAASLLTIATTGTLSNTMSLYNVAATESATLGGSITVNNATFDVESGDTLTISGGVGGSGGVTKNGTGTLILSGSNTYSGVTVVNSGTLNANHANALGNTANVTVNGGSLLVSTDDAINSKNLILASSTTGNGTAASLVFSGTYNGTAGSLTLNQDSIIDLGTGSVVVHFADLFMSTHTLSIYNWTGTTLWAGGNGNNTDQFYIDRTLTGSELNNISFYSGIDNSSFVGTAYQLSGGSFNNQVIPVPEPETYATAVLLLLGGAIWTWRRRAISKNTLGPSCGNA